MIDLTDIHLRPSQLNWLLLETIEEIDGAQKELARRTQEAVYKRETYVQKRAVEMLKARLEDGTVQEKAAIVDSACSKERLDAHLAEGLKDAALEAVRNGRQKLSAVQSLGANSRLEEEMSRAPQPDF